MSLAGFPFLRFFKVPVSNKGLELFTCKDKSDEVLLGLTVEIDLLFVILIFLQKSLCI